ncbi:NAD(P)/FAD-dependent oxidoreductase [Halobacteriaceae archaeon GCM10025711]
MTENITIVGGGTGGLVLANNLADELRREIDAGDVEVRLITDDPIHYYKPTYLYIPFGEKEFEDAQRPVKELIDHRIDLVIDRVTGVDTGEKHLTGMESEFDYDHLVLATGAQLAPEETPGLVEGGHHFYGPEGAEKLRDALADFEEGHLVMSVVGVPHMCPVAPLEFVFMADDWFRKRGLRDDIEITYTYPIQRTHSIKSVAEFATPLFEERGINYETFFNAEEVDPDEQVIRTLEGTEMDYDLLVAIPPHKGLDMYAEAGLGDSGWVEVDKNTLASKHAEDVYALGDAADLPTSKAGSAAHYQAGPLAHRLAAVVRGNKPTDTYQGKTLCFVETGEDEATFLSFNYGDEPTVRQPSTPVHWAKLSYNEMYWLTAKGMM